MFAFSFGKITAIYYVTIWNVFIFDFPSMNTLNTILNTTALKYTVVFRRTDRIRCYCLLFRRVSTLTAAVAVTCY